MTLGINDKKKEELSLVITSGDSMKSNASRTTTGSGQMPKNLQAKRVRNLMRSEKTN